MGRRDPSPQQVAETMSRLEDAIYPGKSPEDLSASARATEKRLLEKLTARPVRRGRGVWDWLWPEPLPVRRVARRAWLAGRESNTRFEWGHWISGEFVPTTETVDYAQARRHRVEAASYEYLKGQAGLVPSDNLDLPVLRARAEFAAVWAVMTSGQRDEVGLPDVDGYLANSTSRDYPAQVAPQRLAALKSKRPSLEAL